MNVTPNQENKTFVDFEDFCHRWNRHKGFKKPTKPVKERAAERWAKIQIDDLDLDLAMDGYYLSEWGKEAGYPMPGFTKNPYSWIPLAAPVDIPAPEVIPINSAEVPLADLPLVLRTDYPARWNELVPAKPVVWDPRRGPEKALRACEEDPVFCEMFDAVCRQAQKIHEVSAPDWLNFEFVIRRSEKGLGWWRVLNEFQGMATPQEKSKVRQTQAQKNSDMVAQYQARLQREIEEEAKQNVAQV